MAVVELWKVPGTEWFSGLKERLLDSSAGVLKVWRCGALQRIPAGLGGAPCVGDGESVGRRKVGMVAPEVY